MSDTNVRFDFGLVNVFSREIFNWYILQKMRLNPQVEN